MMHDVEEHITAVEAIYRPLTEHARARLPGVDRLWNQFDKAVAAFRQYGLSHAGGVFERVNELTVTKVLLKDVTLESAPIEYEPAILTDGPRFDFAIALNADCTLYVEVKTVARIRRTMRLTGKRC
jgi:hypothetical protein